ncbi:MAG TPA: BON domain-containing protein [Gaiellaceae bacterium]|jgi:osmotically-inducible protein OsmY|nr:BON domain-containing protein [Gaiellaceae bacterium]
MPVFALGAALGALVAYFFDPQSGRRRRHVAYDRTTGFFRTRGARTARAVASQAHGVSQHVRHLREEPKDFDDVTLANKVRSEALRGGEIPAGEVSVNVQNGIVQLRGQVERPDLINTLVERVRKVQGVVDVENLLHVPGTEAPMHE